MGRFLLRGNAQGFKRGRSDRNASANPRASRMVSGSRPAARPSMAATPLAAMMPVTATKTAGMPVALTGPISIVNVRWVRAMPRKTARTTLALFAMAFDYHGRDRMASLAEERDGQSG